MRRLVGRLIAFWKPSHAERELDREVTAHLALLEDDLVARGLSREEARTTARRRLGGIDQTKERHRDARSFPWIEDLRRDVPYALRGLRRAPGFTAAAIGTLALGIGATTTVFSVVNAVMLQPLPYKDSDRLVRIAENRPVRNPGAPPIRAFGFTRQDVADWRPRTRTLSEMATWVMPPITLMPAPEGTVRLTGAIVSWNLLPTLGPQPIRGRLFTANDAASGNSVVVISHGVWVRHFQSDPQIIGRRTPLTTLGPEAGLLDGRAFEVIGVLPADFDYPRPGIDFWALEPATLPPQLARSFTNVIARLADDVSIEAAADEANSIGGAIRPAPTGPQAPSLPDGMRRFEIVGMKDVLVASSRPALKVLSVAVAVVLLIVCANVANLLIARGTTRQREIAVRLAIGAGRGRIVRQILAESLVLALLGGALGGSLAAAQLQAVRSLGTLDAPGVFSFVMRSEVLPRLNELSLDASMLLFTVALATATAVLFGLVPALQIAHTDHLPAMGYRTSGAGGGASRGQMRLRNALVLGQLVLATMLLVGAGLLLNSFAKLSRVDPGYQAERLLTFYLVTPETYPTARKAAIVEDLLTRLRGMPRVEAAGFSYAGPILGVVDLWGTFLPPGTTREQMENHPDAPILRSISFDYFRTTGTRMVEGRTFTERDGAGAPLAVILNATAARRHFGSESPVGKMVRIDGRDDQPAQEVIGVVEDMRTGSIGEEPRPQMFVDYRQLLAMTAARKVPSTQQERLALGFQSFVVRTDADPASLMPEVRALVNQVDPALGIDAIAPMRALVATSLTRQRFFATFFGLFAAIAAVLGAVGIYGVLAYAVVQRTQEIGVRMALGAQRGEVLGLILRRGALLASVGIALGIASAAGLSRYLTGMLYGLTPLDPITYVAVAGLFALIALVASYLPARRATKVDPMVALRCE